MADESNQPSRAVSNVRQGVLCIGCEYELAGLPTADGAVCPECGLSIEKSLTGPLLRYEGVTWLERVERGFVHLRRGLHGLLLIYFGFFGIAALVTLLTVSVSRIEAFFQSDNEIVESLFLFVFGCMSLWFVGRLLRGVWLVTDPPARMRFIGIHSRLAAREYPHALIAVFVSGVVLAGMLGPGMNQWIRLSTAIMSSVLLAITWWCYRSAKIYLTELDRHCAGPRVLPAIPGFTKVGIVIRLGIIAFVGRSVYYNGLEILGLVFICFLIASMLLIRVLGLVRSRVHDELLAASYADEPTIGPS